MGTYVWTTIGLQLLGVAAVVLSILAPVPQAIRDENIRMTEAAEANNLYVLQRPAALRRFSFRGMFWVFGIFPGTAYLIARSLVRVSFLRSAPPMTSRRNLSTL